MWSASSVSRIAPSEHSAASRFANICVNRATNVSHPQQPLRLHVNFNIPLSPQTCPKSPIFSAASDTICPSSAIRCCSMRVCASRTRAGITFLALSTNSCTGASASFCNTASLPSRASSCVLAFDPTRSAFTPRCESSSPCILSLGVHSKS